MIVLSPPKLKHRQRNRIVQYVSIGICILNFLSITPVGTPSDVVLKGFDFILYDDNDGAGPVSTTTTDDDSSPTLALIHNRLNDDDADPTLTSVRGPPLPPIELKANDNNNNKKKKKSKTNNGNLFTNLFHQNRNNKNKKKENKNKKEEKRRNNNNNGQDEEDRTKSDSTTTLLVSPSNNRRSDEDQLFIVTSILAFSVLALMYAFIATATETKSSSSVVASQSMDGLESLVSRVSSSKKQVEQQSTTKTLILSIMYKIYILLTYLAKAMLLFIVIVLTILWYVIGLRLQVFSYLSSSSNTKGMITVDPGKVIQVLAAHGEKGNLDSKAQRMLQDFVNVSSCDYATLDVFRNRMEVINFAITPQRYPHGATATSGPREGQSLLSGTSQEDNDDEQNSTATITNPKVIADQQQPLEPALKIGKVILEWDYYDSKPCFNIMMEDVHYLVEYTRATPFVPMLSKSNWDELKEQGVPPEDDEEPPIQIRSLTMKGLLTLRIRSRPFDTDLIKPINIPLQNLQELYDLISHKSKQVVQEAAAAEAELAIAVETMKKQSMSSAPRPSTVPNAIPSLGGAPFEIVFPEDDNTTVDVPSPPMILLPSIRGLSLNEFIDVVEDYIKDKAFDFILGAPTRGVWNIWQQLISPLSKNHHNNKADDDDDDDESLPMLLPLEDEDEPN